MRSNPIASYIAIARCIDGSVSSLISRYPFDRAAATIAWVSASPNPKPRAAGDTNRRFISHAPSSSGRKATHPIGFPRRSRASSNAPSGAAYLPGSPASSASNS